jgi:RNase H-fold protein (predicted Holliday junction resolvase)
MAKSPLSFIGTAIGLASLGIKGVQAIKKHREKKAQDAAMEQELQQQTELAGMVSANQASMDQYATETDLAAESLMKKLSAVGMSYTPLKMKAKEANRAATMMKISGADTMSDRSSLTYKKY